MLEGTEKTRFRSLAATLNYTSLDRSEVHYAAKERYARRWRTRHEEAGKGLRRHADP